MSDHVYLGGFPTHTDLAPTIIFLILYILTTGLLLYRLTDRRFQRTFLWRPLFFAVMRIVAWCLRLSLIHKFDVNVFIAELVFLGIGTLTLLFPIVAHLSKDMTSNETNSYLRQVPNVLRVALLTAAILIIVGSADSSLTAPQIIALQQASSGIVLGLISICLIFYTYSLPRLRRNSYIMMSVLILLMLIAVMKFLILESNSQDFVVNSRSAFYIWMALLEWFAVVIFAMFALD